MDIMLMKNEYAWLSRVKTRLGLGPI